MYVGIIGLLGIVFVVLKLCGVIEWAWIWVLIPFWIGFALMILGFIIWYLVYKTINIHFWFISRRDGK